jgi:hypothetical protein
VFFAGRVIHEVGYWREARRHCLGFNIAFFASSATSNVAAFAGVVHRRDFA